MTDEEIIECLTEMCKDVNIQQKYEQTLNSLDSYRRKKQIEDEVIEEFVDYLKSTQVSKLNYMGMDYIEIEDIELALKEFEDSHYLAKWLDSEKEE